MSLCYFFGIECVVKEVMWFFGIECLVKEEIPNGGVGMGVGGKGKYRWKSRLNERTPKWNIECLVKNELYKTPKEEIPNGGVGIYVGVK